nr:zinc finger, CCHC-type [Tanacetum cinerariifolium]
MAAYTERMEKFENAIFKQREEINDMMAEMFRILKELITNRASKKVLVKEEAKYPVTKNVNSISLTRGEEEKNDEDDVTTGDGIEKTRRSDPEMPVKEAEEENEAENGTKNKPIKSAEREESVEAPSSQPVGYYMKCRINEKLIEGLVDNHRKEDIGGNFEIPYNIGGLKHINALIDQGSDVNVVPLSTYMKLIDERPVETGIRLSLASHSYIYPLGIAEDVLVDVAGYNDNKGKPKHQDTKANPNKKSKVTCWKCGKLGYLKKIAKVEKLATRPMVQAQMDDDVAWWVDSGATVHVCKDRWNNKYFVTFIDDASRFCYVYLIHTKDEALDKFKVFKTEVELQQGSLIKRFRTDREVSINSIIELRGAIFDENRFSLVPRPSLRIPNGTKGIGGLVVHENVTKESLGMFLSEKEAINDEMDSIMGNNTVGNKMHKEFPLPVMKFPLQGEVPTANEESSHCQKKRDATAHKIALLLKSSSNCQSKSYDNYAKIQQYLQHEHYALWEVIEFGDSYEAPVNVATTGTTSDGTGKKKGRTVTLIADDMQKRKNDVKARTTLPLSLPDEHQLRFKWLMHTIVWRNKSDLDTMSLDDLYNHLKVYESEVQKKSESNSQNMAFISSVKHSSGNEEVNTASVSTASTNVSTAKEMDIKWNMAILSMRADRLWKKTGKKISIQGIDVAGFDKSKVKCFNYHKMGHFARECRAPKSHDRGRRDNYRQGSKVEEQAPKALMAIDGLGWEWSYMANDEENHALIADEETPIEFALMAKTSAESEVEARLAEHRNQELKYCEKIRVLEFKTKSSTDCIENLKKKLELIKKEKEGLDSKLAGFQTASKDLDSLLKSQILDKNKEGLGYSAVPPPSPAQVYSPPKKDLSWIGLPEFKDDTVTDYSRPSPAIKSTSDDAQNKNPFEASPSTISLKSFIKFMKANDSLTKSKTYKVETAKKPRVKKFPTGGTKFSTADMGKKGKAVKASACWFWKPSQNLSNKGPNSNSVSVMFKKYTYIDTQGRLKDFKLLDDANVLLRTHRQHNMYIIDLNNIVPHKDLTCLIAKASADEGMLWHRRLGHLNVKTMN